MTRITRRSRSFQETARPCFATGLVHPTAPLSFGQEVSARGIVVLLGDDRHVFASERAWRPHQLDDGDLAPMMAESVGREAGHRRNREGPVNVSAAEDTRLGRDLIISPARIILSRPRKAAETTSHIPESEGFDCRHAPTKALSSQEAGTFLLSLWKRGQELRAEELVKEMGYADLDAQYLIGESSSFQDD